PAEGRGRQAPVLRRLDHGPSRGGARRFHLHRRKRLGLRAELAPPPDGGAGRRSALKRHPSRKTETEFGVWVPLLALGSGGVCSGTEEVGRGRVPARRRDAVQRRTPDRRRGRPSAVPPGGGRGRRRSSSPGRGAAGGSRCPGPSPGSAGGRRQGNGKQ